MGGRDLALADLLAVVVERDVSALAQAAALVGELHTYLVLSGRYGPGSLDGELMQADQIVGELESAFHGVEDPAAEVAALGDDHALGGLVRGDYLGGDRERPVLDVDDADLRQTLHPREEQLRGALDEYWAPGQLREDALDATVVQRQHVVPDRLDQQQALQFVQLVRHLPGEVARLAPVLASRRRAPRRRRRTRAACPPISSHGVRCLVTALHPLW